MTGFYICDRPLRTISRCGLFQNVPIVMIMSLKNCQKPGELFISLSLFSTTTTNIGHPRRCRSFAGPVGIHIHWYRISDNDKPVAVLEHVFKSLVKTLHEKRACLVASLRADDKSAVAKPSGYFSYDSQKDYLPWILIFKRESEGIVAYF